MTGNGEHGASGQNTFWEGCSGRSPLRGRSSLGVLLAVPQKWVYGMPKMGG